MMQSLEVLLNVMAVDKLVVEATLGCCLLNLFFIFHVSSIVNNIKSKLCYKSVASSRITMHTTLIFFDRRALTKANSDVCQASISVRTTLHRFKREQIQ